MNKNSAGPSGNRASASYEPERECGFCPRLVAFRQSLREAWPNWHNAPVPTFGETDAPLLVVGLAPGLRGANRTGRPFTGDFAGDLLYQTLLELGLAEGVYEGEIDDGLRLISGAITNAVRCVPPQNKPLPVELSNCRPFLAASIAARPGLRAIVALGRIAHDAILRACGKALKDFPFAHGAEHVLRDLIATSTTQARAITLFDSYHCSRYNTNTGVLTPEMFRDVFSKVRESLVPPG
ncbi:MAG TPA: uracil-DNA glycosylase [Methylocella sp.]|nr:uracil-DNA glycosylase [Methylocella sp.]